MTTTNVPTDALSTGERARAMRLVVWDVAVGLRRTYGAWPSAGDVLFWMTLDASDSFAARLVDEDDVAWLYAEVPATAHWTDLLVEVGPDGVVPMAPPLAVLQGVDDWLAYMAAKGEP